MDTKLVMHDRNWYRIGMSLWRSYCNSEMDYIHDDLNGMYAIVTRDNRILYLSPSFDEVRKRFFDEQAKYRKM